ncbi:LysR family transcriptional regulator [Streptomyces mirabilis]|uniref:LysR family transcriptional regulator n=1 Tax=Streptomyces mirabilis TaxID=68239 RepID=UPI0036CFBC73
MERHEIEAFLTLADELHFRRTSERLGLAQGRVSQTIKKIERRIGVPLFERTSRRVTLTPAGRQLHNDLAPAYRAVQEAIARAVAAGRGITGTLCVGFSAPWSNELVVLAADLFRARYPGCDVRIREVQLADPLGPLRAEQLDVQLTEFPVAEPDLVTGPTIFSEPRGLMVPAKHSLTRQASVSVEDMARLPMVVMSGEIPQYWLDHHYPSRTPQGRPIAHAAACTYWQEVLTLVSMGRGASPAALRAAQYHMRPGIIYLPLRDANPIDYGLLWRRTGATARVKAFAETVCEIAGIPGSPVYALRTGSSSPAGS